MWFEVVEIKGWTKEVEVEVCLFILWEIWGGLFCEGEGDDSMDEALRKPMEENIKREREKERGGYNWKEW